MVPNPLNARPSTAPDANKQAQPQGQALRGGWLPMGTATLQAACRVAAREAGLDKPVLLVSAGPGWGKTTLLSAWAHSTTIGCVIAWLTVEPADIGRQFWRYVHAALTAAGARGPDGEELPAPGAASDDGYLTLLVNALAAMPAPAVLILDDVHVLADTQTLAGLGFLVRHAGTRLRLVLAASPALPLQRWRVRGELSELHAAQLAFTDSEAKALLVRDDDAHDDTLGDEQVATLQARTEGWPAGLRLAELSMRDSPDRSQYVDQFGGGYGAVGVGPPEREAVRGRRRLPGRRDIRSADRRDAGHVDLQLNPQPRLRRTGGLPHRADGWGAHAGGT